MRWLNLPKPSKQCLLPGCGPGGTLLIDTSAVGRQAIEAYKAAMVAGRGFDLVIMDLTIPGGMVGKDAVREILELDPYAKCIVSSGYASDPIMANAEAYGFKAAIEKPHTLD